MLETARFFHQFAALLKAGIPVQQSLGMAGKDCSASLQRSLKEASLKVDSGQDLATALNGRSPIFDQWTIALIRSAEYSGSLADTFERLAIATETRHRRQKLYSSVVVSSVIVIFTGLVLLIALTTRSTAFVIAQARSLLYFTELELPLHCGIPILQALELIRVRIPDLALRQSLAVASRQIQAGQSLSQSLAGKLPPLALQMIRTGEETGNLDTMLGKLAAYYESDLERQLKQLQAMLRPLSILAAGMVVLLIGAQTITSLLKALPG